jgi:C2H2 transcription facotor
MDASFTYPQSMEQSPFFYYNPDPKPDNRQHGHFSQHPNVQGQMHYQQAQPILSTPGYSRPGSSCSQPPLPVQVFNSTYQSSMTPMASPRPVYHKPTVMIQDQAPRQTSFSESVESDMYYYPSTPPLSTSGSTISSPSSCEMLQTPLNAGYFGLESFEGVKEGCQGEVQSENLAGGDWARCGSPPMTPGKFLDVGCIFVEECTLTVD